MIIKIILTVHVIGKSIKLRQFLTECRMTLFQTRIVLRFSVSYHEIFIKSLSFIIVHYDYIKGLLHYRIALHEYASVQRHFSSHNDGTSNFNRCVLRNSDHIVFHAFSSIIVCYKTLPSFLRCILLRQNIINFSK